MRWEVREKERLSFPVRMEVIGKQRPRVTMRGGHAQAYTPKKTRMAEAEIAKEFIRRFGSKGGFSGPVAIDVVATRPLCKSNPKWMQGIQDAGKPDIDNVLKLVMDALEGVAYKNDAQVVRCSAAKRPRPAYGARPYIYVRVTYYETEGKEHECPESR